jgi:peptidoglycan hydrolase-like protein with peptidoglycan-binding domain
VRRALLLAAGLLPLSSAPARAADCTSSVAATRGPAPLTVTFTSTCEGARWSFGDGATAEGASVTHVYAAGRWQPGLETATGPQALPAVTAFGVSLSTGHAADFGAAVRFTGKVVPAAGGMRVSLWRGTKWIGAARTHADGTYALTTRALAPGPYTARFGGAASSPLSILVRPILQARVVGSGTVASPLRVEAALKPRGAGRTRIRVWRRSRLVASRFGRAVRLDTSRETTYRIVVTTVPAKGFAGPGRTLAATVALPTLELGAHGPSVLELERRLAALHYALAGVDASFGQDTYDAVLALQGVNRLAPTGRVDRTLWRLLEHAASPKARYPGNHVEVDKARQVLFIVRGGRVALAVHVSTGATGNTPLGVWHVYRKVAGWSWVLWYPSYFLRGFAIHGYPEVPPYPASHGCVRVPMWVATRLYPEIPYGSAIYIYA